MISTPEFKQHLFQPLHNLPESFQVQVPQQIMEKVISLQEMKASATQFRSLQLMKMSFVRIAKAKCWEEACIQFPDFTTEARLEQFLPPNFKHGPPEVFQNYCDAPLASKSVLSGVGIALDDGCSIVLVCTDFSSVTAEDIQNVDPAFTGAHLIMTTIPKVRLTSPDSYTMSRSLAKISHMHTSILHPNNSNYTHRSARQKILRVLPTLDGNLIVVYAGQ